ncbi:MAG: hypothetical protein AAGJ86_06560 [Pseudomonadota bacterium]
MTSILSTAALAGETPPMAGAELAGLLTGNTVYILVPPKTNDESTESLVPFKFGADRSAVARLSNDTTLVGTWTIDGDQYCVDWNNGPKNSCSRLLRSSTMIRIVDAATGDPRGRIAKIVPGNPERL